jgi:cytochrome c-type biogenesis protein CcmE
LNERSPSTIDGPVQPRRKIFNKYVIGGLLIVVAAIILAVTSLRGNAQYYLTVNELLNKKNQSGQNVRISGVVLGDTIAYDANTGELSFEIANIPGDNTAIEKMGGLAKALHSAAIDTSNSRLKVVYHGTKPDLLTNEAQAILTGSLDDQGVFQTQELLLKCPSRYEDAIPAQTGSYFTK